MLRHTIKIPKPRLSKELVPQFSRIRTVTDDVLDGFLSLGLQALPTLVGDCKIHFTRISTNKTMFPTIVPQSALVSFSKKFVSALLKDGHNIFAILDALVRSAFFWLEHPLFRSLQLQRVLGPRSI